LPALPSHHEGFSVIVAVEVRVPNVAVTVTSWVTGTVPTVTTKVTVVVPEGTVILDGNGNRGLEVVSVTVVKPVGTATLRITAHVVVPPEATVLGLQVNEDSTGVA
jgi:hypothetical protein